MPVLQPRCRAVCPRYFCVAMGCFAVYISSTNEVAWISLFVFCVIDFFLAVKRSQAWYYTSSKKPHKPLAISNAHPSSSRVKFDSLLFKLHGKARLDLEPYDSISRTLSDDCSWWDVNTKICRFFRWSITKVWSLWLSARHESSSD